MKIDFFNKCKPFIVPALFICLVFTGCTSTNQEQITDKRDPFESTNRKIYAFNDKVDTAILEPVAAGYNKIVPKFGKEAISRHINWVGLPNTAINSGLQGKWENLALSSLHFSVNALTFGFANLLPEEEPPSKQDLGKTFAVYGVSEGPYVVLPLLGSRTSRHAFAQIVNMMLNPYAIFEDETIRQANLMQPVLSTVSWRAANFDLINSVKYNSLDSYIKARSAYYQSRFGQLQSIEAGPSEADDLFEGLYKEG
ncbi:MAG: VacJ family lipoprotein [Alphaproteobacteria bacterium]|nr:VacJ family lipoprotein [Alphaproteobacteria bacterium]